MSASRQIRPLPGSGGGSAGNRKTAVPALSSTGSSRSVSTRIGKYEVETEVSGGTQVRVFHGWDRATGRRVTLKVLTDVTDTLRAERFRREVAAMANLRNASVVSIYELGEHVGMPFAAVEYLGDEHLGDVIEGHRAFTLLEKMRVMGQVAEGVQAAHLGGLAYMGLRPRGIALCADGSAKIQDFGIVRITGAAPGGEGPRYEEEAASAGLPDRLSDVFAFGVIYYELLSGAHPFLAAGGAAALRETTPECPEPLEQLVARAMEPDRELRYQSLDDIQYDAEPIVRELERKRAAALVEEARRWMESRELDHALIAVREALDLDPGSQAGERLRVELRGLMQERTVRSRLEALLREAEEESKSRRYARAAELLESAARLDTSNRDVAAQLQKARSRLEQNRRTAQQLDEVRQALERRELDVAETKMLEALSADPENAEVIGLARAVEEAIRRREMEARIEQGVAKARSLLLVESFDAALEILSGLEAESPGSPVVAPWLAHVKQQKEQAERRGRFEAQLDEARSLMRRARFAEAAERLEKLSVEYPQEQAVSGLLAECWEAAERADTIAEARTQCDSLCRAEQFEQARVVAEAASRAYPDNGDLAALRREVDEKRREFHAAATIRQVLEEAQWLLDQDRVDLAVQFLKEKYAALPDQPALASRLAAVEQLQAEWERRRLAQDCLRRVAALELAQQWTVALMVVEEALESDPGSGELREAVERLRVRQREQDLQKKLARSVTEVRQALADGDIEQAEQTLRRGLDVLPEEPVLLELGAQLEREKTFREQWRSAQVLVGRRQFEEAERILGGFDEPARPEVQTLLKTVREARAASEEEDFYKRGREKALLLIQQKQNEQAADLLRNLLSLFPGDPILLRDLHAAGGARREVKPEAAPAAVEAAKPAAAKSVEPRRAAAPPRVAAWYRRWPVIAGLAFLLVVSAGTAVTRKRRGGLAPSASKIASTPARAAVAPSPPAVLATPAGSHNTAGETPVPIVTAVREPAPAEAREPRPSPLPARRPFNGATLSTAVAARTAAVLVPAPPISGTAAANVDPLPAGVTAPLRAPAPPPPPPAPAPRETAVAPPPAPAVRATGGNLQPVQPISLPPPVMPLIAKERRITGVVNLEGTVDKQGAVTRVRVAGGNPLLVPAALEAVKRWRYQPAKLNGEAIEADVKIEVRFQTESR